MMRLATRTRLLATCGFTLLSFGCKDGQRTDNGQTGSPYDDPPEYQNSSSFVPDLPGRNDTGGPPYGSTPPDDNADGELAGFSDGYLVVAGGLELRVFDVSGAEPVEVGSTPLGGAIQHMEIEEGRAWIAIREASYFDGEVIPEERQPNQTSRLIAFDLSDPEAPSREAEIDFENEIWAFERRGTDFFAIEHVPDLSDLSCGEVPYFEGTGTAALRMSHVSFSGGAFEALEKVEVETPNRYGFYSEDTFFIASRVEGVQYELSAVEFGGGTLVRGAAAPLGAPPRSVARRGNTVVATLQDGTSETMSLAGPDLNHAGSLAPEVHLGQVEALSDGIFVALNEDRSGSVILDVSDPALPYVASELAPDVQEVLQTEHGLIGVGTDGDDNLVVSLWDLADPAAPLLVDSLTPGIKYSHSRNYSFAYYVPGAIRSWTYDPTIGQLAVPDTSEGESKLALISVETGALTLNALKSAPEGVYRPTLDDSSLYEPRGWSLLSGSLSAADDWVTRNYPSATSLPSGDVRVILNGEEYSLHRQRGTWNHWVTTESTGEQFPLTHVAEDLVVQGDRLVAIGTRGETGCETWLEVPSPTGQNECTENSGRGVTILDVDGGLRVAKTLKLPSTVGDVSAQDKRQYWLGFFTLDDGRLVFAAQQTIDCNSRAECEELGVPAHDYASSRGCDPSEEETCDGAISRYAEHFSSLRLYTLEAVEGDSPAMEFQVETSGSFEFYVGGGLPDLNDHVFRQPDEFGLSRAESVYSSDDADTDDNGDTLVAHFFTTFSVEGSGAVRLGVDYNVPGRPILWQGGELITAAPEYISEERIQTTLHRSELINGGAFIKEDYELDGTFHDARHGEDAAYLLLGPEDVCDQSEMRLLPLSLSSKILAHEAHPLAGHWYWSIGPSVHSEEMTIGGGPVNGAHAIFSLLEPTSPKLIRYTTE